MSIRRVRELYFSPDDDIRAVVENLPNLARASLHIEAYGFTDMVLVGNIIGAARRGVRVRLMNDHSQSAGPADRAALQALVDAGLPNIEVRVVESERGAIDHLKMIIVDGDLGAMDDASFVGSGSYNLSGGAEAQDNSYCVDNDPGAVAQALAKFSHDWTANKQDAAWQIVPTASLVDSTRLPNETPQAAPQAAPSAPVPSVTVAVAGVPPEAVAVTVAPPVPGPLPAAASIEQGAPN